MSDNVNHPSHYVQGKIECIDGLKILVEGLEGAEAAYLWTMGKYLWRAQFKNGEEDIMKARWYYNELKKLLREDKE